MESQIGYIQIQIHLWVTTASKCFTILTIYVCPMPRITTNICRMPFPKEKTASSTPGSYRRVSRIPKLASRILSVHLYTKETALSTPEFYRRVSRMPNCQFSGKNTALGTPEFCWKISRHHHMLPRYHIVPFVIHVQITISQQIRHSNISHDLIGGQ